MIVSMGFNGKQENINMSTEKHKDMESWSERYKIIEERFFEVYGKECTYKNIEEHLGIGRGKMPARVRSLSSWSADDIMVLHEKLGLNLKWIFYGIGQIIGEKEDPSSGVNEKPESYAAKHPKQDFLDQCKNVLESDTFYANALESNIIAFNSAVLAQAMQKNLETRINMLQSEVNNLKGRSNKGKAVGDV